MSFANMISVVVCTYNQEKTIGRALDSILRQHCSWPIEIIIGEDCSTDHTLEICREYAERYPQQIRLIANTRNKGLLDNYYDCLLMAKGKYIADLAGDDEWCDNYKLEKELAILEQHPEVVLVHTDYRMMDPNGAFHLPPFNYGHRDIVEGKSLTAEILKQTKRPVVHLCTALYRNEVFRQCYEAEVDLFRNHAYPCEDIQLCALLSQRGSFAYIDAITLNYSTNLSISNSGDETKQFKFVQRATQLSFDLQQRLQIPMDESLKKYYSYRVYALMMHAFRAHQPNLREQVRKCACLWQAQKELRTICMALITSNATTWSLALSIRKQLLKLLRH